MATARFTIDTWPSTRGGRIALAAGAMLVVFLISGHPSIDTRNLIGYSVSGIVVFALAEFGARVACWVELGDQEVVVRSGSGRSYRKTRVRYDQIEALTVSGRRVDVRSSALSGGEIHFSMNNAREFADALDARREVHSG